MAEAVSAPVALVTGGAKRIGRAIVEDLAAHGWAVAIHCHVSRERGGSGRRRHSRDVAAARRWSAATSPILAGLDRIVAEAAAALGPLTLLVNNASIFETDAVGALDRALWRAPDGDQPDRAGLPRRGVRAAAAGRARRATSSTCSTSASGGRRRATSRTRSPSRRLFTATETLAQALAPRVRVNGIAPGPTLPNIRQDEERFRRQAGAPSARPRS